MAISRFPLLRMFILYIPNMYLAHSITLSALHANVSFSVKLSPGYFNPVQSNTYSSVLVSSISSSALIRNSQYLANSSTYFAFKKKSKTAATKCYCSSMENNAAVLWTTVRMMLAVHHMNK